MGRSSLVMFDSDLDAEDLVIRGTLGQELDGQAGMGLEVQTGCAVSVKRAALVENTTMGVITDNPVGVNIQDEAFDVTRLTDGVLFLGNGRNLDTDYLPGSRQRPLHPPADVRQRGPGIVCPPADQYASIASDKTRGMLVHGK